MLKHLHETNINAEKEEEKLDFDIEDVDNDHEFEEFPPIKPKRKKKKKRGFLGYILGAISIAIGAALTFCSGGLFATFGYGLIMNGVDLIMTNY